MKIKLCFLGSLLGLILFNINQGLAAPQKLIKYGISTKQILGKRMTIDGPKKFKCSDSSFNGDPAHGFKKVCYKLDGEGASPVGRPIIAKQGESFPVNAGEKWYVMYTPETTINEGFASKYIEVGTKVVCSNSTFGADPYPYNKKICYFDDHVLAHEGETFTVPNLDAAQRSTSSMLGVKLTPKPSSPGDLFQSVMYGIHNGHLLPHVEMHFKGPKQFKCSDSTFKHDPTPGYKKVCYKLSAAGSNVYGAPIIAKQNETFTVKAGEEWIVRYQPESNYQYGNLVLLFQSGTKVKCDNATFSADPWPGNKKACYVANTADHKLLAHEGQTFTVPGTK